MDREALLEHDLTRLIYQLSNTESNTVGLLSSLPLDGGAANPQAMAMGMNQAMPQPWVVLEQMQQLFDVTDIDPDSGSIPEGIDVLMLVHPKQLPAPMLYAIDQYILRGGRALIFVDPNAEVDRGPGMMGMGSPPGSSELEPLFAAWGVQLVAGKVAGDLSIAERVRYGQQQGQGVIDYPVWMNLPVEQNNATDVVTARLGNLVFASPGILNDLGRQGITVTPLVTTTENAMQFDVAQLQFVSDPTVLLVGYEPGNAELNLAVRVSGPVGTAFPDGPPAFEKKSGDDEQQTGEEQNGTTLPHLNKSTQDANMIIVADSDMLADDFWVQAQNFMGTRLIIPSAANGDFVINSLESLLGSNDLISVRSRGQFSRPFTRVTQIQQAAEVRYRQKERQLLTSLDETEIRLVELEKGSQNEQQLILSDEQVAEIEKFREQKIRIRKELRLVRHQLRKDIEKLESATRFINIGLIPLLIGVGGLFVSMRKMRHNNRTAGG